MSKEQQTDMTAQEKLFLSLLFTVDENGLCKHPEEAKLLAGYAKDTPITDIIRKVNKELLQRGDEFLAAHSPIAIMGLLSVLNDPTAPGSKIRLQAASDLLDRAGITKKDKSEAAVEIPNYIIVMPSKLKVGEVSA